MHGQDASESTRRARKTSLRKRARNRKRALSGRNRLQRARTGAESGLAKPTRKGILTLY